MGFKTHFEVEKMSAVKANRGTWGSTKQPFYILHKSSVSGKIIKKIKIHGGYLGQKYQSASHEVCLFSIGCCRDPPSIKKRVFKKICRAISEISAHCGHFLRLSRELDRFEPTFQAYCKNFWPIVTEKKAKTNFDQIVSTTMGQSYKFLTRIFFF